MTNGNSNYNKVWIGLGIGAAVGLAAGLRWHRNGDRWYAAKRITRRVADRTSDLAETGNKIFDHVRVIYNESRKLADDAADLWSQGRKLAGA